MYSADVLYTLSKQFQKRSLGTLPRINLHSKRSFFRATPDNLILEKPMLPGCRCVNSYHSHFIYRTPKTMDQMFFALAWRTFSFMEYRHKKVVKSKPLGKVYGVRLNNDISLARHFLILNATTVNRREFEYRANRTNTVAVFITRSESIRINNNKNK